MAFLQAYYTSCTEGLLGMSGFQYQAASTALDENTLSQIMQWGQYIPSRSHPLQPTDEQITAAPLSLSYYRLPDGRAVLVQSKYLGRDYSGRWGNYFAHFLVSSDPRRDFGGLRPIECWGSPVWSDHESPTRVLPLLDHLPAGPLTGTVASAQFAPVASTDCVAAFLTGCEVALMKSRRLAIVGEAHTVASWIALASHALPHSLAVRLTFTSYTATPNDCAALIVGTTDRAELNASDWRNEFVFDLAEGSFRTPQAPSHFGRLAASRYAASGISRVARFSAFLDRVAPATAVDGLAAAWNAHSLIEETVEQPCPEDVAWARVHINSFELDEAERFGSAMARVASTADVVAMLAASARLPNEKVRSAIERQLVPRLLRELDISESVLGALPKVAVATDVRRQAQHEIDSWLEALESPRNAAHLCGVLRVGTMYLAPFGHDVSARVARAVFPYVAQRDVVRALLEVGAALWPGFTATVVSCIADSGAYATNAAAIRWLREQGRREEADLLLRTRRDFAVSARLAPLLFEGTSVDRLRSCLAMARQFHHPVSPTDLDAAFESLFIDAKVSAALATEILHLCGKAARNTVMCRRFQELAAATNDATVRLRLAESLHDVEGTPEAAAFLTLSRLRFPDIGSDRRIVEQALDFLESRTLPPALTQELTKTVTPAILKTVTNPLCDSIVIRVAAVDHLRVAFEDSLRCALALRGSVAARIAAGLLRICCSDRSPVEVRGWLSNLLKLELISWTNEELAKVREHFTFANVTAAACEQWVGTLRPGVVARWKDRIWRVTQ